MAPLPKIIPPNTHPPSSAHSNSINNHSFFDINSFLFLFFRIRSEPIRASVTKEKQQEIINDVCFYCRFFWVKTLHLLLLLLLLLLPTLINRGAKKKKSSFLFFLFSLKYIYIPRERYFKYNTLERVHLLLLLTIKKRKDKKRRICIPFFVKQYESQLKKN